MIIKAASPPEIFESLMIAAIDALEHFMWCNNLIGSAPGLLSSHFIWLALNSVLCVLVLLNATCKSHNVSIWLLTELGMY